MHTQQHPKIGFNPPKIFPSPLFLPLLECVKASPQLVSLCAYPHMVTFWTYTHFYVLYLSCGNKGRWLLCICRHVKLNNNGMCCCTCSKMDIPLPPLPLNKVMNKHGFILPILFPSLGAITLNI